LASCKLILNYANDIVDFTALKEHEHIQPNRLDFSLKLLLVDQVLAIKQQALFRGLLLFLDIQPNIPTLVNNDPIRLTQIIQNLLSKMYPTF
jgi:two-component system capsular synthesis sensor histidine kinase RcsC